VLRLAKRYGWIAVAAIAIGVLVWGSQSISIPTTPVAYKECLQAAQQTKQDKNACKLSETIGSRTLTDPVAYYTFWLTLFTGALAVVGIAQWGLVGQQIQLGRQEFIATHRPRVKIRHIYWTGGRLADGIARPLVEIHITNVGDAVAEITKIAVDFNVVTAGDILGGNMDPRANSLSVSRCGLGDTLIIKTIGSTIQLDAGQVRRLVSRAANIYCFGYIEYTDLSDHEFRKTRRTAFCRMFVEPPNPISGTGRFLPLDFPDPDYEYED
jgi:hypothetical protein